MQVVALRRFSAGGGIIGSGEHRSETTPVSTEDIDTTGATTETSTAS
jgi:hypothetical protein